jgi:hypothetical protein
MAKHNASELPSSRFKEGRCGRLAPRAVPFGVASGLGKDSESPTINHPLSLDSTNCIQTTRKSMFCLVCKCKQIC